MGVFTNGNGIVGVGENGDVIRLMRKHVLQLCLLNSLMT